MIEINVKKRLQFSSKEGYLEVSDVIKENEFVVLYGPSGAGKTTFLKILAGLVAPEEGSIIVDSNTWMHKERKINLSPQKRSIGLVFQDYALFPNMNVKQNLLFVQEERNEAFLNEVIELLGLEGLINRKPDSLSGGQKQRTALARAIIRKPRILLLDEPLSSLDKETRISIQEELLLIHRKFNLTTLMVSHDIGEIVKLANRVLVLEEGRIKGEGDPTTIFSKGKISGKVKIVGDLIKIQKEDIVFVLTIVIGNNIVKVVATEEDIRDLRIGDKVMIVSKAFNPIILKI